LTGGNLWRAFTRVADVYPGHEAFCGSDVVLTYCQLATAASELADRLSARDIGVGDLVAVATPVGPDFVTGMLAACAVGAAYLPMDVSGPAKRQAAILEHARPAVVLRDGDVPSPAGVPASRAWARHAPATGGDDPAYVIYTSGSTGTPKGVVVPARGVHNLVSAFQRRAPVGPGARHSWWTSPGFDVSVYEIWSALSTGGSIVPVLEAHRRDVDATLDHLAERRVESAYLPPQFLPALRDRVRDGGPVPPLRRLLTGVEPIPIGLLVEVQAGIPGVVVNGYGPTETTVCATLYTVPDHCAEPQRRTPIGAVIEGNRGFVLDDRLTPVEPGRPGELFVAGAGVALGYLHDPERTAERFLPAADGDGVMYRTGDVVVSDGRGELTFQGRVDDQLKVDGVRIEPAETEAVLRRLPEISDVAVLAWPAAPGGPSVLTAFVVLSPEAEPVPGPRGQVWPALRERLAEELPSQAVPRRLWVLDRIPMTPDGKLDRARLPQPEHRPVRQAANPGEQAVVEACRAVLADTPAALLDLGFAEAGGDSLGATRVALALRTSTGRAVTAADVLAAATMADLATGLAAMPRAAGDPGDGTAPGPAPLTPAQFGMWAAEMTGASPGAFHEAVAVEFTGSADPSRIAEELAAVLNRHAVFRGRIDDDTLQLVVDGGPVRVPVRPVRPGETPDEAWRALVTELQRPAFDFDHGPLVRAAVLAEPGTARVLIVWHHLVVDAWSARVVLEELAAALSGAARPGPVEHGFADYASRQSRYLASPDGKQAVASAADRVRAWLPDHAGEPAEPLGTCRVQELAAGPRVWSKVRECGLRNGATTLPVFLAAVLGPLCRLAGTRGRFALAVADRDAVADADAAGYFLTTVPFHWPLGDEPDSQAALRRARDVIAEAQATSRVPFASLMAELGLRDPGVIAPLVIAWDRDVTGELSVPGCTVRSLPVRPLGSRWPWTVLLTDHAERGMSGRIEFPPSAAADEVAEFASRMESILDAFASRA
jgi:amino acid adenylation domain-containing protein